PPTGSDDRWFTGHSPLSPGPSQGARGVLCAPTRRKGELMPSAVCVGDTSTHGGTITGPGVATVLIGGKPAAVVGDMHVCSLPPNSHQPTVSVFPSGSSTVMFGGRPALRTTDTCICGAMAAVGAPTVTIG